LKQEENFTWRVAGLELFGERMGKKVLLCTVFIFFQGIVDYQLEAGGRARGRGSRGVDVGHKSRQESKVRLVGRTKEMISEIRGRNALPRIPSLSENSIQIALSYL